MQRLGVGLAGLGFVLMLVVFSSAGVRPQSSLTPAGAEGETLSVLGVAPSSGEEELRREMRSEQQRAKDLLSRPARERD